jgi:flagellin-like hook-associated protein FlgL
MEEALNNAASSGTGFGWDANSDPRASSAAVGRILDPSEFTVTGMSISNVPNSTGSGTVNVTGVDSNATKVNIPAIYKQVGGNVNTYLANNGLVGGTDGVVDTADSFIEHYDASQAPTLRAGGTVSTQQAAQQAITAINEAIVSKDKIRAHLGAIQNRLENTISNLNLQAENLQAAESRISDVDVATEMTEFTRQQILSQSAVAMLAQANSLPQMAMQLIGG